MESSKPTSLTSTKGVMTYLFNVVVEPDEDEWHAYCPALKAHGAVTTGRTKEEAFRHINDVVRMIVDELLEDGKEIPRMPAEHVEVLDAVRTSRVALTI